ncbi:MAG: hypothetical protein AAGC43_17160, partial [Bacteroidota bacterium]
MLIDFLKFGFLHDYITREKLLTWSDKKLMNGSVEEIFTKLSSITKKNSNVQIIEIFNEYLNIDDPNLFELYHYKFLSFLFREIKDWK